MILGDRITKGLIVVKYGHTQPLSRIRTIEAGHPEPDENGMAGANAVMAMAGDADDTTLVITLISGGGSALLPLPMRFDADGNQLDMESYVPGRSDEDDAVPFLTLSHKQAVTRELLRCGADITEINCIRKHLSGIKGGRLAHQIAPASSLSLILSDVVGDDLSAIASGPTAPDPTTYHDALSILKKYQIADTIPAPVRRILEMGAAGDVPDTPFPGDPVLKNVCNLLIGTNRLAMLAAGEKAEVLGYGVVYLTSRVTGEAADAAKFLAGIAVDTAQAGMLAKTPVCIISGGEPVVTLRGGGKGGRNQEMALVFLSEIQRDMSLFSRVTFLAASTDGNDGPTDAAGAFASQKILKRAAEQGLSISGYLNNNDAYHFFEQIDGLLKTGPTNTNVCDLHIILVTSSATAALGGHQ